MPKSKRIPAPLDFHMRSVNEANYVADSLRDEGKFDVSVWYSTTRSQWILTTGASTNRVGALARDFARRVKLLQLMQQ